MKWRAEWSGGADDERQLKNRKEGEGKRGKGARGARGQEGKRAREEKM